VRQAELTPGLFRDIDGTATFYITSKIKHRAEIRALQAAILDLEETLEDLDEINMTDGGMDDKLNALGQNVETLNQVIQAIKMDTFAIGSWPKLRAIYLNGGRRTREVVRTFASVYSDKVAKLL
jgi:hypothetical protein